MAYVALSQRVFYNVEKKKIYNISYEYSLVYITFKLKTRCLDCGDCPYDHITGNIIWIHTMLTENIMYPPIY